MLHGLSCLLQKLFMDATRTFPQWPGRRWLLLVALTLVFAVSLFFAGRMLLPSKQPPSSGELIEAAAPAADIHPAKGKELYSNYCLPCHGEKGGGDGPASRFLYPKPRNFGEGKFRIVTSANRMPSDQDLLYVLNRGMPGSAMFPFSHLSESDRLALVGYVQFLMRAAYEERARQLAAEKEEEVDAEELAESIDRATRAEGALTIPGDLPPPGVEAVARGREVYRKGGCTSCHGDTGKGDGAHTRDGEGEPPPSRRPTARSKPP